MKKLLLFFAVLLTAVRASAKDYDFKVDGIYYKVISECEVKVISGSDYGEGDLVIPSSVSRVIKVEDKTNGNELEGTMEIFYSVVEIGDYAFFCCPLTSVVIGNSVTTIGDWAFVGCPSLTSVKIPNSVTEIGDYAFTECPSLESFTGKFASADHRCLIVDGVLKAFAPAGLTSYEIPESVTTIGDWAFGSCSSLTSIEIPNSVTSIEKSAFGDCSSLTSVEIPNSVTSIGSGAFGGCSSLTSVVIGNSVTAIEEHTFWVCSNLTSVVIGNSVTTIGNGAFQYCTSLTSVVIGNSVKTIGPAAFDQCESLKSVEIPNSVTEIGGYAFLRCSSLTSVVIGNSVTEIEWSAFEGCSSLKEIISLNTTPPTVYGDTFRGVDKETCVLKVPRMTIGDYKTAVGWKDFYNIVGLSVKEIVTILMYYYYFDLPDGEIMYYFGLTDEEIEEVLTSVSAPEAKTAATGKAYNLQGMEVPEGYRGIVIRNGKKILK